MGTGTDAARAATNGHNEHADMIDNFKDQLIVALLKRLKNFHGEVSLKVAEIDDTGNDVVSFAINQETATFEFVVSQKH